MMIIVQPANVMPSQDGATLSIYCLIFGPNNLFTQTSIIVPASTNGSTLNNAVRQGIPAILNALPYWADNALPPIAQNDIVLQCGFA